MPIAQLLFSFEGRIGRVPFWLGTVLVWVGYGLAFTAFNGLGGFSVDLFHPISGTDSQSLFMESMGFAVVLIWVAFIVRIDLALQVKRWHDRAKSAWWVTICTFPVLGVMAAIIECGLLPGDAGPNRFGRPDDAVRGPAMMSHGLMAVGRGATR